MNMGRKDLGDEALQKGLWEYSENMVQEAEKRGALKRAEAKNKDKKVVEVVDEEEEVKGEKKAKEQPAKTKTNGSRRSKRA